MRVEWTRVDFHTVEIDGSLGEFNENVHLASRRFASFVFLQLVTTDNSLSLSPYSRVVAFFSMGLRCIYQRSAGGRQGWQLADANHRLKSRLVSRKVAGINPTLRRIKLRQSLFSVLRCSPCFFVANNFAKITLRTVLIYFTIIIKHSARKGSTILTKIFSRKARSPIARTIIVASANRGQRLSRN